MASLVRRILDHAAGLPEPEPTSCLGCVEIAGRRLRPGLVHGFCNNPCATEEETAMPETPTFQPPAAADLPDGVLDSAVAGASALDAWASRDYGRNVLAHALVQLQRDGWLRQEPAVFTPRRDDAVAAWLKQQRDAAADYPQAYDVADGLLDGYRLHADTGTPLHEHCCEGGNVDDCAGCYDAQKGTTS